MKKYSVLSLLLVFYIGQTFGQVVETLAVHPKIKDGMYVDTAGNVYTTSGGLQGGTEIGKYDISTSTFDFSFQVGFFGPIDIDERANGDYVVTNFDDNTVSTVDLSTGVVTTIATGLDGPAGIAIDENDNIYVSNYGAPSLYAGHQIHKISPAGVLSVLADDSLLFRFQAMVFNGQGELIVSSQNKLLKVDTVTGAINVWVDLVDFGFGHMIYRTLDSSIYGTATGESKIYKVDAAGVVTVYAGTTAGYQDGDVSTAKFNTPLGIEISPNEDILYIGDSERLRRILMNGNVGIATNDPVDHQVFPNPSTNGRFTISNDNHDNVFVEVFDQAGRRVLSSIDNKDLIQLDLSDKQGGVYILKLRYGANIFYHRLVNKI